MSFLLNHRSGTTGASYLSHCKLHPRTFSHRLGLHNDSHDSVADTKHNKQKESPPGTGVVNAHVEQQNTKSIAERDAELMTKYQEHFGGMATAQFENGQPTEMKSSVRNNMFRCTTSSISFGAIAHG